MKVNLAILLLATFIASVGIFSPIGADAETPKAKAQSAALAKQQLANEWAAVKTEYPVVAMEYLRREALIHQLTVLLTSQQVAWSHRLPSNIAIACDFFTRLQLQPPDECKQSIIPPLGAIADCFEPQPDMDGGFSMPSASEAEACVEEAKKPQQP